MCFFLVFDVKFLGIGLVSEMEMFKIVTDYELTLNISVG